MLSGLGGIGKTQMAVEYAHRYALEYASIFWLNADTMESTLSSYSALAALLELPEQREPEQQKMVAAVKRWLNTHRDWSRRCCQAVPKAPCSSLPAGSH